TATQPVRGSRSAAAGTRPRAVAAIHRRRACTQRRAVVPRSARRQRRRDRALRTRSVHLRGTPRRVLPCRSAYRGARGCARHAPGAARPAADRGTLMAARDDVLRELGLAPRWRLRTRDDPAAPDPVEIDGGRVESPRFVRDEDVSARAERIARLPFEGLADDIACCRACPLGASRTCAVPGVGTLGATRMFFGEAPGAEEDARGEPFVGAAGRLLDNML